MKKIIILLNNAGGVGKTAAVASLAGLMAAQGLRILVVDLDPQATLTRQFLPKKPSADISAALRGGTVPIKSILFNLDIIPATPALADVREGRAGRDWLARVLAPLQPRYDYILIDCPPSLGFMSCSAIAAADYILSPVLPDLKSLYGLQQLEDAVDECATKAEEGIDGVFLANYNARRNLDVDIAEKLKELYGDRLFGTRIRQCNKVRECLRAWTDVATYAPRSNAAVDFRHLLRELQERLDT